MKETKKILNVLIACEESQAECMAFRNLGHNAFSCDLQPCRKGGQPEWHIKDDVRPYLRGYTTFKTMSGDWHEIPKWDLIVAHPPCTYLCKVSSIHMRANANFRLPLNGTSTLVNYERWQKLLLAREFFFECLDAQAFYVAVENPCPMKLAQLPPADAFACPSWFGCKYTKKTYYWLKNLPPLMAEFINPDTKCLVTSSRGKYRSRTFPGLANALAHQWSDYILQQLNNKL